jgi:predicted nucleotidyltransferase
MQNLVGRFMKAVSILAILFFIVSCGDTSSDPPGRPDIQVDPTSHNFGNIDFNQSSLPFEVTISNPGTASLSVSNISLLDTSNFTLNVNGGVSPCVSATPIITAGGNCTVEITFAPRTIGNLNTRLEIDSDDPIERVALFGNAVPLSSAGAFTDSGQDLNPARRSTESVALGDVDGDNDLDVVFGNFGQSNKLWLNDVFGASPGTFTDSGQTFLINNTFSVTLGDLDGDGSLDIVEGNQLENRFWLNNGSGSFSVAGLLPGNARTESVVLGKIDIGESNDIVTGNSGDVNQVLSNNGSGLFTNLLPQDFNVTSDTRSVALGDVEGDGDLDIVEGNFIQANQILFNDGAGIFTNSGQDLGNFNTVSVALGDVDGDGDIDIVTGNFNQLNRVWVNTNDVVTGRPTGTYVQQLQPNFAVAATSSIALGDVEGDGDLDIVAGNSGQPNRVWLNDGTGTFADSGQLLGSSDTTSVALGDVEGDGDLDIVEGNNGQPNRIWLNQ